MATTSSSRAVRESAEGRSLPVRRNAGVSSRAKIHAAIDFAASKAKSRRLSLDSAPPSWFRSYTTTRSWCGIAQPGHIIVSEPAYARLGARFECDELAPTHVKGKEHALRIFKDVTRERPQIHVPTAIGGDARV